MIAHLLQAAPTPLVLADVTEWKQWFSAGAASASVDAALAAGFSADRIGYAFASGYAIALGRMIPAVHGKVACLAVTEAAGAHPKKIAMTLRRSQHGYVLDGVKTFATLAPVADVVVVIARNAGAFADRRELLAVTVPLSDARMSVHPPTPFAPEIPHAELAFAGTAVSEAQVLRGDGYADYTKPFRTIEDVHVHAAVLGYVVQVGRRCGFQRTIIEDLLAVAEALVAIGARPAGDAATHLALAGTLRQMRSVLLSSAGEWAKAEDDVRGRWERDQGLFAIAEMVRAKRTERAWEAITT
ncbi:MAG: acyl-CoA dehydrogenase family protein [Deltaproteobacteria bacterium]|nr:acyl-CoA dehydrogenase family protein [Deltaproteobacteria bacterium]